MSDGVRTLFSVFTDQLLTVPAVCFLLARHAWSGVTIMIMGGGVWYLYICVLLKDEYLYLIYFNNIKEKENTLIKKQFILF